VVAKPHLVVFRQIRKFLRRLAHTTRRLLSKRSWLDPKRYNDVHFVFQYASGTRKGSDAFGGSYAWLEKTAPLLRAAASSSSVEGPTTANEEHAAMVVVTRQFAEQALAAASVHNSVASKGTAAATEWIFLVDCSGSMAGTRISNVRHLLFTLTGLAVASREPSQAATALQVAVRSLPAGARFNILRFGDRTVALFPYAVSVPVSDETVEAATFMLRSMKADLGGTELAAALRFALSVPKASLSTESFWQLS
jgi:hypothetical protein